AAYTKNWTNAGRVSIAVAMWVASFIGCYVVSLRAVASSDFLLDFWNSQQAFVPLAKPLSWFVDKFVGAFENPFGFSILLVAAMVFFAGCVSVILKREAHLLLLLSPIPFVLLASGLHKYPFGDRLLLFMAPSIIAFVSIGVSSLFGKTRLLGILVLATLL